MILILINWIYILLLSFFIGKLIIYIINIKYESVKLDFSLVCIVGLIIISWLTALLSIFIKTGLVTNSFLVCVAILGFFLQEDKFLVFSIKGILSKQNTVFVFLGIILSAFIILKSNTISQSYDENLYYLQTIKWMENYPAIPGLGNLHGRLAFNSSWHLLSALFSFTFLGFECLNDLNGLLFFLVTLYSIKSFKALIFLGYSNVLLIRTLYPLFILYFFDWSLDSSNPDFPTSIFCWLILDLYLEKVEKESFKRVDGNFLLIVGLSVFVITIKLSILPIILIPVYLFIRVKSRLSLKICLISACLIFIVPFLIRNVITSGYLFYPLYQVDFFEFDWKVPVLAFGVIMFIFSLLMIMGIPIITV